MCRFLIFSIVSSLAGFHVNGQDTLKLKQAIELGLKNNYSIIIARNAETIARNNNTLGNAGFLPDVNANFNNTNNVTNSRTELASGVVREGSGIKNHSTTANALVNWTIFDGFNMFINRNRLDELQKAGEFQARMNVENTLSQIVVTYYAIVQEEKVLGVITEAMTLSSQRLKLARVKREIGSASEQTVLQAIVDINADSTRYIQQQNVLRNIKSDLNRLLARDVNTEFEVSHDLQINNGLRIQDLQEKLNNQNAQLLLQRANVRVAEYAIESYRSLYYPTVNLFGGYNYNKNVTPVGVATLTQSNGLTYGLTASFNIFSGGVTRLNVQNSKILLKSNQLQYEDTKLLLQNDLNKYYNNYQSSMQLIRIQQSNIEIARKDLEIAVGRFKLGNISDIDLRITQQKLIDAESTLLSAEYSAKQAEIELQRLSGQLLNVLE